MPDTPRQLRGEFYPTSKMTGCPAFSRCVACKMCTNYTPHNVLCQYCEERKRPVTVCICTPKTRLTYVEITNKLGRPMFDPNGKPGLAGSFSTAWEDNKWEKALKGMAGNLGRVTLPESIGEQRKYRVVQD